MTDSRFMSTAVGGSFAVHLTGYLAAVLLVAGKGLLTSRIPPSAGFSPPPPPEEMTMLTPDMIIVEEIATPQAAPGKEGGRDAFVDASGMREAAMADSSARFEADRNTLAGSESEARHDPGASPDLPAQSGADIPSIHVVEASPSGEGPVVGDGEVLVPDPTESGLPADAGGDEALRNEMKGAAPRRAEVAVTAVETPRARYETAMIEALRSSKNRVVGRTALPIGSATVRFHVTREGRKVDPRFLGRPTDPRIGDAALSAVLEARLPEIPEELFEDLPDGRFPFTYEFISY